MKIERKKDLFFVEHGDLDEDHRIISGAADLEIVGDGLQTVTPLGLLAEELDKNNDDGHVHLLHEQHYRHYQAQEDEHPEEGDDHRRLNLLPY